ncbi:PITH domain-containing protein [Thelonectria olida]|uniref:PITH domain-containing protein n=1 Tax=Thelonectria olida TaxID=1576542 RepID=A0A9P8WEL9_9HYPO|nr:PITH domain-containing protein [Thelonectria olida]
MSSNTVSITSKEQFDGLLKTSFIVVADFWAEWCAPCKQIAPIYETLAESLSRPNLVTFVKVNNDTQTDLSKQYGITALPTFVVFRDGVEIDRVQGADQQKLKGVLKKTAMEMLKLGEGDTDSPGSKPSSGNAWRGAEIPRGCDDITDQIELKGCELLNADEDAGPVKVLFETSKPSALEGKGKATSKDWTQSGADDQLLLYIPLQSIVKLHTLQITSLPPQDDDEAPMRPGTIHLFVNRTQNLDFDEAEEADSTQTIELSPQDWNDEGTVSVSLRYVKFQKTSSLIIFVRNGDGDAETVRIDRIRLLGEAGAKRNMGKLQKIGDDE